MVHCCDINALLSAGPKLRIDLIFIWAGKELLCNGDVVKLLAGCKGPVPTSMFICTKEQITS